MRPLLLVGLLLVAGCRPNPPAPRAKAAPPAALPAGWSVARDAETGASFALPPGWRVGVPRSPVAMPDFGGAGEGEGNAMVEEMRRESEAADAEAEKEELAKMRRDEGIVLHAVDSARPTIAEEPTRIYLRRMPEASDLRDAAGREYRELLMDDEGAKVELPIGTGWRLAQKGRNRIGDEVRRISYVVQDGERFYVLRFASTNAPTVFDGFEREVARSLRLR